MQTFLPLTFHKYYIFWVIVCSLRYPQCKEHVQYFHVWPVRLYHIFPHYLIKDKICEKILLNIKCVFCLLYTICLKYFSFQEELSEIWWKMYMGLHIKHSLLSFFNTTFVFSSDRSGTVVKCCATNLKVAGSIPASVNWFFVDIKSFRSHYGPWFDSASSRNEYQEYFLGVQAAGA